MITFPDSLLTMVKLLSKEEAGELFLAIAEASEGKDVKLSNRMLEVVFAPFKAEIQNSIDKAQYISDIRKNAGQLGGKQKSKVSKNDFACFATEEREITYSNTSDKDTLFVESKGVNDSIIDVVDFMVEPCDEVKKENERKREESNKEENSPLIYPPYKEETYKEEQIKKEKETDQFLEKKNIPQRGIQKKEKVPEENIDLSYVPEPLLEPLLKWFGYKKRKRQGYKDDESRRLCCDKLKELSGGDREQATKIINNAIAYQFSGFYNDKQSNNSNIRSPISDREREYESSF